ncbi:MAG: hypothetical protein EBZ74_05465 [Planctomycetia bacterium]|nr:hypothetical protein [Planctomycetia bacterium]
MKIRSCVLLACLVCVPLVAMFSHKVPREWRLSGQRLATAVAAGWVGRAEASVRAPAADMPAEAAAPEPARPAAAGDHVAASRADAADRLRELGAVSFECVPLAGGGAYRCSCRVPADRSGQLQRVFQSSNPDPEVALKNLVGQVRFWKQRVASDPAGGGRPAAFDSGPIRLR